MLSFLKTADRGGEIPLIVRATQHLLQRIDTDLWIIVNELLLHFGGQIACVTGVTINTADGNFFCPSTQAVRNDRATGKTVTLT